MQFWEMRNFVIILCCFFMPVVLGAQVEEVAPVISDQAIEATPEEEEVTDLPAPSAYVYPTVSIRPVSSDAWQKATSGMNYSDDVPKAKKEEEPRQRDLPNFNWDTAFWAGFAKIFSIIILILLIGLVIYQVIQSPSNQTVRATDGTPITFDNLDAYIQETDLERFLREAIAGGNYSQAVRIYYLQVIKELSQQEAIQWSREKTNRDYLREMRSHVLSSDFRSATHAYEEVWYGNLNLDQNLFSNIENRMKGLLQKIT